MLTKKQIAANRRNAARSTGPKSAEGKQASSRNAFKHGLAAQDICIEGVERTEDLDGLVHDLIEEYRPSTRTECILVERMAHAYHHSKRALRLILNRYEGTARQGGVFEDYLKLLHRYHKDHDRSFLIALEEVRHTQAIRRNAAAGGETPAQTIVFASEPNNANGLSENGFVPEKSVSTK